MAYCRITLKRIAAKHSLVSTRCDLEIHPIERAWESLIMYRIFAMKICSYPFSSGKEKSERRRKDIKRERN
jgi:hypothetical protein